MCFFLDQNICAILFCGEKFVTLDTDTKRDVSSLLDFNAFDNTLMDKY